MNVQIGTLVLAIGMFIGLSCLWMAIKQIIQLFIKPVAIISQSDIAEREFKQQCDNEAKRIIQRKKDEVKAEAKNKNCIGYILTRTAEERAADYAEQRKLHNELVIMASIKQREELAKYKKKYPNEFKTEV